MHKRLKIGIVGCGAIGSSLAKAVSEKFSRQACISGLFDVNVNKSNSLSDSLTGSRKLTAVTLERLIKDSDLVIEASSADSSWHIAEKVLKKKRDIMLMSVGGVIDKYDSLLELAKKNKTRVYIPSGAISGIDALKASTYGKIKEVVLTTTKNPASFKGVRYLEKKNINVAGIKKDTVLFCGSAKEAVRYFPQNINVAAILSMSGIGERKTKVIIIASPKARNNIHEIRITSEAGKIYTRTENVLHRDNPKTSYLAYLSAVACLKQILEPVRIGT